MSRYIPKQLKDTAPCCEHCTPDNYEHIHHIIPLKIITEHRLELGRKRDEVNPREDKLTDAHTNNIVKLCKECHDDQQLQIPERIANKPYENNLRCYICGEWTCTHKFRIFGKEQYFCYQCTHNWLDSVKWYIEFHHKGYRRRRNVKLILLVSKIEEELSR